MLTAWLVKVAPFLSRWLEVAPACCGTCPTCIAGTVTGLSLTAVAGHRDGGDRAPRE